MRKIILSGIAILGAAWGIYLLVFSFIPHEDRIRWMLLDTRDEFNDQDFVAISGNLSMDFKTTERGLKKQAVTGMLLQFFKRTRKSDGSPGYRVEIRESAVTVEIDESQDPPTAEIFVPCEFFVNEGKNERTTRWKSLATVDFTGTCILEDGRWKIRRAKRQTTSGQTPF